VSVSLASMPRPKKPPTRQARVREDLLDMLEVIALARRKDVTEIVDERFRKQIEREHDAALKILHARRTARQEKPSSN
jgi:hypothetical protein